MAALTGVALVLSGLAFAFPEVGPVMLSADLALLTAVVFDWLRTPSPQALGVARSVPERVGLSRPFARTVRISAGDAGKRAAGLRLELHEEFGAQMRVLARTSDDPRDQRAPDAEELGEGAETERALPPTLVAPADLDPSGGEDVRTHLPASGPVDLVRTYAASKRGIHRLGDLRLRLTGPLGLVRRQARHYGNQDFAVEPALPGLRRTLRLAASERWRDLGVRNLRRRGASLEFESMREYVRGDDVRALDWKAFAKRGRPMVREYQEERGQELILVVDAGRRMAATTALDELRGWTKLDHALDAALQLAAVALGRGDRVGIATFDTRMRVFVPPARGAAQFARLKTAVFDAQPLLVESSVRRTLHELSVRHPRRATLILLSDVADPYSVDEQRRALGAASKRHRVVLAALDDPAVRAVAEGTSEASDDPVLRASALRAEEVRSLGLARLGSTGVRVVDSLPAEAAAPLLAAWLEMRRQG